MRCPLLAFGLLVAACGGHTRPDLVPEAGPAGVVEQFMQAVADSNLSRMADLWGASSGSAAQTGEPPDYQRRIAIMHAYLRGSTSKVLSEVERSDDRVVLAVEVARKECVHRVPFTMVRTRSGGWLVNAIDLAAVGTPGRACSSEQKRPVPP